jgi:hypothetical protein
MIICVYCKYENREGTLFCEQCGSSLYAEGSGSAVSTRHLEDEPDDLDARATWGTARFDISSAIIMKLRDTTEPIIITPADETVFGRVDAASGTKPDLDLTPFGALDKGVSRLHAALRRGEETLTLVDLGSVNGTFLNGQRLIPNQPRVLRDGDEIRLGKMVLHIYFK